MCETAGFLFFCAGFFLAFYHSPYVQRRYPKKNRKLHDNMTMSAVTPHAFHFSFELHSIVNQLL